jgi:hypothetical protein
MAQEIQGQMQELVSGYVHTDEKSKNGNGFKNQSIAVLIPEDKYNLVEFFALLIKVDKRINPHLYKFT